MFDVVILREGDSAPAPELVPAASNAVVPAYDGAILLGESVGSGTSAWILIGAGLLLLILLRRLRGSA